MDTRIARALIIACVILGTAPPTAHGSTPARLPAELSPGPGDSRLAGPGPPTFVPQGASAADGVWSDLLPTVIDFCSLAFDSLRDRVVVLGQSDVMSAHRADGAPGWQRLVPLGSGPPVEVRPKLVVSDPARDRLIVLCPVTGALRAWSLTLTDPPRWEVLAATGTPPDSWWYPSAMYDPRRDQIVVFGGYSGRGYVNDVWTLSLSGTPAWSAVATAGTRPVGRAFHTATYDPVRDRMVVHGGLNNPYFYGLFDTWALSLSGTPAWERLNDGSSLPSGQYGHTAEYDPIADRLLVSCGFGGAGARSDTWALSLVSGLWSEVHPATAIPARGYHASCYDRIHHRVVIYGGRSRSQSFPYLADLWALDLDDPPAWIPLELPPTPRANAAVTMDPATGRLLLFGGRNDDGYLNDVWALEPDPALHWTELHPLGDPPSPRASHTLIFDAARDRAIVFGGTGAAGPVGDTWSLDLAGTPRWQRIASEGSGPSARFGHVAADDAPGRRMFVFGGAGAGGPFADVWTFDLTGAGGWKEIAAAGEAPSGRVFSAGVFDPTTHALVVFGGMDQDSVRDDLWRLSVGDAPTWTSMAVTGSHPSADGGRYLHGAALDPEKGRMLIYGGADRAGALNDTWELDLDRGSWRPLSTGGTLPGPQVQPAVAYDTRHRRLLLFGVGRSFGNEILSLQFSFVVPGGRYVGVDVRPGDDENVVHPGATGVLPVAILSSTIFDATAVDPLSVHLAGAGVRLRPNGDAVTRTADVDGDGRADLVLDLEQGELELARGDTLAILTGRVPGAATIFGYGRVRVVAGGIHPERRDARRFASSAPDEPALLGAHVLANARVLVSVRLAASAPARLDLVDVTGRRIDSAHLAGGPSEVHQLTLGTAGLAPGLYWVRLEQLGRAFTRRVAVVH